MTVGAASHEIGRVVVRLKADRSGQIFNGSIVLSLAVKDMAARLAGGGGVGVELKGEVRVCQRALIFFRAAVGIGTTRTQLGAERFKLNRGGEIANRAIVLAPRAEDHSSVHEGRHAFRIVFFFFFLKKKKKKKKKKSSRIAAVKSAMA